MGRSEVPFSVPYENCCTFIKVSMPCLRRTDSSPRFRIRHHRQIRQGVCRKGNEIIHMQGIGGGINGQ